MSSKDLLNKQETKHNFLWVKFLTRFFLWISALYNLLVGAYYIDQAKYNGNAIYEQFAQLQKIDFEYGIVCCILFVMFLTCVVLLSCYRRYADAFLIFCYVLDMVSTIFYILLTIYVKKDIGTFETYKVAIYNICACWLLLIINICYFNKKSHIFR